MNFGASLVHSFPESDWFPFEQVLNIRAPSGLPKSQVQDFRTCEAFETGTESEFFGASCDTELLGPKREWSDWVTPSELMENQFDEVVESTKSMSLNDVTFWYAGQMRTSKSAKAEPVTTSSVPGWAHFGLK